MSRLLAMTSTELVTDPSDFWHALRDRSGATKPVPPPQGSLMEAGVRTFSEMSVASPRTLRTAPLVKSRPVSPPVRAMLETLQFDRRFGAVPLDVA
jgi:hypothetical protein